MKFKKFTSISSQFITQDKILCYISLFRGYFFSYSTDTGWLLISIEFHFFSCTSKVIRIIIIKIFYWYHYDILLGKLFSSDFANCCALYTCAESCWELINLIELRWNSRKSLVTIQCNQRWQNVCWSSLFVNKLKSTWKMIFAGFLMKFVSNAAHSTLFTSFILSSMTIERAKIFMNEMETLLKDEILHHLIDSEARRERIVNFYVSLKLRHKNIFKFFIPKIYNEIRWILLLNYASSCRILQMSEFRVWWTTLTSFNLSDSQCTY